MSTLVLAAICALAGGVCGNVTVNAETSAPETMIPRPLVDASWRSGRGSHCRAAAMGAPAMAVTHEQSAQQNNVIVDVDTCSAAPASTASEIADNVTARW